MHDAFCVMGDGAPGRAPDAGRLVLERELTPRLLILMAGAAAVAVAVATSVDVPTGPSTLGDAAVRRFDLTVLWVCAMLAGARIAMNLELDERAAWLDSFIAAGASRRRYLAGVGIAAYLAAALVFVTAALAFALAVLRAHDTRELVHALPRTVGMGLLALGHWCVWFALIGVILRRALPVVAVAIAVAAAPTVLMFVQLQQTGVASDVVLRAMLLLPPLIWGGSVSASITQLLAMAMMAVAALACARRMIGRHT